MIAALCFSSTSFAHIPSPDLVDTLDEKLLQFETIIQSRGEDFRVVVLLALNGILSNASSYSSADRVEYIVTYIITGIENNAKRTLTRADFADSYDGFAIVQMPDQVIALVRNSWPLGQNNDDAFEFLSSFIFGNNSTGAEIAMTSPVMRMPLDANAYETAFIMPDGWTLENLPKPNTDRIFFKEVPWSLKAVKRFSWRSSTSVVNNQRAVFQQELTAAGIERYGLPTLSLYDGPWVAGNSRRNELWVELNE